MDKNRKHKLIGICAATSWFVMALVYFLWKTHDLALAILVMLVALDLLFYYNPDLISGYKVIWWVITIASWIPLVIDLQELGFSLFVAVSLVIVATILRWTALGTLNYLKNK